MFEDAALENRLGGIQRGRDQLPVAVTREESLDAESRAPVEIRRRVVAVS